MELLKDDKYNLIYNELLFDDKIHNNEYYTYDFQIDYRFNDKGDLLYYKPINFICTILSNINLDKLEDVINIININGVSNKDILDEYIKSTSYETFDYNEKSKLIDYLLSNIDGMDDDYLTKVYEYLFINDFTNLINKYSKSIFSISVINKYLSNNNNNNIESNNKLHIIILNKDIWDDIDISLSLLLSKYSTHHLDTVIEYVKYKKLKNSTIIKDLYNCIKKSILYTKSVMNFAHTYGDSELKSELLIKIKDDCLLDGDDLFSYIPYFDIKSLAYMYRGFTIYDNSPFEKNLLSKINVFEDDVIIFFLKKIKGNSAYNRFVFKSLEKGNVNLAKYINKKYGKFLDSNVKKGLDYLV